MSSRSRFTYSLEPVLLTRQWELDALQLELGQANAELERRNDALEALRDETTSLVTEWKSRTDSKGGLAIDQFRRITLYLGSLATRITAMEKEMLELEQQRDDLMEKVFKAKRAVEALEEHKSKEWDLCRRELQSLEFKDADDHWSTTKKGVLTHDLNGE